MSPLARVVYRREQHCCVLVPTADNPTQLLNLDNISRQIEATAAFLLGYTLYKKIPSCILLGGGLHAYKGLYYDLASSLPLKSSLVPELDSALQKVISQESIEYLVFSSWDDIANYSWAKNYAPKPGLIIVGKIGDFYDVISENPVLNPQYLHVALKEVSGVEHPVHPHVSRIYGIGRSSKEALLTELQEFTSPDHKTLGREMNLFHFNDTAPGMAYWHEQGYILQAIIKQYLGQQNETSGYQQVKTPILAKNALWEETGHTTKYLENMFFTHTCHSKYVIRPMNCPMHAQLFNFYNPSYRDLPLRFSEFGLVHRNESSGSMQGLFRARSFVQDDGHVFCSIQQVASEIESLLDQAITTYKRFGFRDITVNLALKPQNFIGDLSDWEQGEVMLAAALNKLQLSFTTNNDGAFYGPKIEFHLQDSIGRLWQCGTIQLDFCLAKNLQCFYTNTEGLKAHPVVIHRAILGSIERFIGILLEHYNGHLPIWLAPIQLALCTFTESHKFYAQEVLAELHRQGIRCRILLSDTNLTLNAKLRSLLNCRIPFVGVIGKREEQQRTVSIRDRHGTITILSLQDVANFINQEA